MPLRWDTKSAEKSYAQTPSNAAAIRTPARLDRDSRTSRVSVALPALSAISSATLSSPACRDAPTGSRRNALRKMGSASRRSRSRAAASASDSLTSRLAARPPLACLRAQEHQHGKEERKAEHSHGAPHDGRGRDLQEPRLVAQRHADREARRHRRPRAGERRVARERGRIEGLAHPSAALEKLLARAAPQARLAEEIDQDLVAVAIHERVQVEERAQVGAEGQLEEDVPHDPGGRGQAAQRKQRTERQVGYGPGRADRNPAAPGLEPRLRGV